MNYIYECKMAWEEKTWFGKLLMILFFPVWFPIEMIVNVLWWAVYK